MFASSAFPLACGLFFDDIQDCRIDQTEFDNTDGEGDDVH